jgi:hypothetical protein
MDGRLDTNILEEHAASTSEDGGSGFLQYIGTYLQYSITSQKTISPDCNTLPKKHPLSCTFTFIMPESHLKLFWFSYSKFSTKNIFTKSAVSVWNQCLMFPKLSVLM